MSRSSDARRPYVRSTRSIVRRAAEGLASAAGRATPIERAHLEPLEPRKLLFSLTVGDADDTDGDGIGQVRAAFGYFIPYLDTNEDVDLDNVEVTFVDENFNDEDNAPVFSGDIFDGSDILFTSSNSITRINAPEDALGVPIADLQLLEVDQFFGETAFLSFRALADADDFSQGFLVTTQVSFDTGVQRNGQAFGTIPGLFNDQISVELRFQGQVVDTYTNAELLAAAGGDVANPGTITLNVRDLSGVSGGAFDELRFVSDIDDGETPLNAEFFIDNIRFRQVSGTFASVLDSRRFAAEAILTAPVGATVSFFDLYGRPMINTLQVGTPPGSSNFTAGDADDNGIPEFNDGIGRIEITGTDANSSFTLSGLQIETFTDVPPDNTVLTEGGYAAVFDELNLFDDFADAGFGFLRVVDDDDVTVIGLPPGTGSVIIGSPFVRPLDNYNPEGPALTDSGQLAELFLDFQISDQGVKVRPGDDGSAVSIGDVVLSSALFGLSSFSGSVGHFSTGYFMGSMSVAGDLGSFYNATDAGTWIPVADDVPDDVIVNLFTVGSQLSVGRTLGEFAVAGRNFTDITVDGDLSAPTAAPADNVIVYNEREVTLGIDPGAEGADFTSYLTQMDGFLNGFFRLVDGAPPPGVPFGNVLPGIEVSSELATIDQTVVAASLYGESNYRNDSILNAEFIGGSTGTALVRGTIGGADFFSSGDDEGDVYAFVADGEQEIVIETLVDLSTGVLPPPSVVRILDADGRTVASTQFDPGSFSGSVLRFTPDAPGAYYISILDFNDGGDPTPTTFTQYAFLISGMAPTTFGSYRTGLGNGGNGEDPFITLNPFDGSEQDDIATLTLLSGDFGLVRTATGFVDEDGEEVSSASVVDTLSDTDSLFTTAGLSISTPGSLWSFNAGGDINANIEDVSVPVVLSIGGDLGQFYTGRSQVVGGGDTGRVIIETGGRIGTIDINGNINGDRDNSVADDVLERLVGEPMVIRTGLDDGQTGDIGLIIVGASVTGDELIIDTSATPGAVVGG
ncbi:MAG: hypothetical protein AAFS11_07775, partial [Planctomycetota bacterium]